MIHAIDPQPKRSRISVAIDPELRRKLQFAAARRDVSIPQYALMAIEEFLRQDIDDVDEPSALTAASDPVLAELWNNPNDAAYDRL